MANPTSNFGWQMPTPTDLVTDLPADFEVFGQAVDTSLADLKGGTTGQVLSKASGTDMDFTWIAVDPLTILDAKGDLISATAADTPARLAVGSNGQVLTADSTASTGIKWATPATPTVTYAGCSAYRTSSQTLTAGAYTAILWNGEYWDTDSFHDTATNASRFTVPAGKAGKYAFHWNVGYVDAAGQVYSVVRKNGSSTWLVAQNLTSYTSTQGSVTLNLAVADYIELFVFKSTALVSYTDYEAVCSFDYLGA